MSLLPLILLILLLILMCSKSNFENVIQLPFSVVIINLDRRPDRWNSVMNELTTKGFPEEIIYRQSAVDGNRIKKDAQRALYLSNIDIWKKHLDGNYGTEWLLVLEDDTELQSGYNYAKVVREFNKDKDKGNHVLRSNPGSCPTCYWGTEAMFIDKRGAAMLLEAITLDWIDKKNIPYDHAICKSKKIPDKCIGSKSGMFKQANRVGYKFIKLSDSDIG